MMPLHNPRAHSSEQGAILVMAIVFLAVLGLLIGVTLRLLAISCHQQERFMRDSRLERALDSGLAMVLARLADRPASKFTISGKSEKISFTEQCEPVAADGCVVRICATSSKGESRYATVRMKLMMAAGARRWMVEEYGLEGKGQKAKGKNKYK